VEHLAWHPQENLLATAAGRILRLWETQQGQLVQEYSAHDSTIAAVAWQPDSSILTSAAYGGLSFWSPEHNAPLRLFSWKGSILTIAWSPNGNYIATGDQDSTVHFWIAQSGKDLQMYGYPTKVRELSWDSTSRYLATGGSEVVTVWDCSGKGPEGRKPVQLEGHTALLSALAFQHRHPLLASASADGQVVLWQIERPKHPLSQATFGAGISQLNWSPDDRLLAIGTEAGLVTVIAI
jgi:WD40 repeat protein